MITDSTLAAIIAVAITAGFVIGFFTSALLTINKVDKARYDMYWECSVRIHQCPNCGEMRTETEANDGECYRCEATGFKNTGE